MSRPQEHHPASMGALAAHHAPPNPNTGGAPAYTHHAGPRRLPSVSLASADLFDSSGFPGGRRQSINSDPFLHAFSAAHDGGSAHARAQDHYAEPRRTALSHTGQDDGLHRGPDGSGLQPNDLGLSGQGPDGWHSGLEQGFSYPHPVSGEHFGGPGAPSFNPSGSVGPLSSYRFGGPSQGPPPGSMGNGGPLDSPSYLDYSMRRPSEDRGKYSGPPSPPRSGSGRMSPTGGRKRKTRDDGGPDYGHPAFGPGAAGRLGAAPDPKRHTSGLAFDKLDHLSLQDAGQREAHFGPGAPWNAERRNSDGPAANQAYALPTYAPPHALSSNAPSSFDGRPPSSHAVATNPGTTWDGRPAPPHYPHLEQAESSMFARRPSIPSVSQMMQGLGPDYADGSSAATGPGGPAGYGSQPPASGGQRPGQPPMMASSVPSTASAPTYSHPPRSAGNNTNFPPADPALPADLSSSGPGTLSLDTADSHVPSRQPSNGPPIHLDPTALAASLGKDSPYSRSPELRVSHKLAERKRRKEMTQLFEDLRDSLPFERGLKASKWEILNKAIEYVAQLKTYSSELADDNRNLRQHYGLPPGPSMPTAPVTDEYGAVDSGRTSSTPNAHETTRGSASPALGTAHRPGAWLESRKDLEQAIDRKPSPHLLSAGGHSPIVPSRLHAQFGPPGSHDGTPQPSPTFPPQAVMSGRASPVSTAGSLHEAAVAAATMPAGTVATGSVSAA